MERRIRLLTSALAAAALAAGLAVSGPVAASAEGPTTCSGGSVAAGTYSSLAISGTCSVDAGPVTVAGSLTVLPGGVLLAAFGGSPLTVDGNLVVESSGALVLGCEVPEFACLNDNQEAPTMSTRDVVRGNLVAEDALAVLIHNDAVGRNLVISGGGGGVTCAPRPELFGAPAYATVEDTTIGGNLVVTDWHSCWLGVFRNTVARNLLFSGNVTADPDGNEVATNTIGGNLNCSDNSPAPQFGDSGGSPNTVAGRVNGQCVTVAGG